MESGENEGRLAREQLHEHAVQDGRRLDRSRFESRSELTAPVEIAVVPGRHLVEVDREIGWDESRDARRDGGVEQSGLGFDDRVAQPGERRDDTSGPVACSHELRWVVVVGLDDRNAERPQRSGLVRVRAGPDDRAYRGAPLTQRPRNQSAEPTCRARERNDVLRHSASASSADALPPNVRDPGLWVTLRYGETTEL